MRNSGADGALMSVNLSVSFALRNLPRGAGRANGVANYR
jgi:hypothetical protein